MNEMSLVKAILNDRIWGLTVPLEDHTGTLILNLDNIYVIIQSLPITGQYSLGYIDDDGNLRFSHFSCLADLIDMAEVYLRDRTCISWN